MKNIKLFIRKIKIIYLKPKYKYYIKEKMKINQNIKNIWKNEKLG